MTNEQKEILAFFNSDRVECEKVDLQTAKGKCIPEKRLVLEKYFPKQLVDDVFGLATLLEQAEMELISGRQPNSRKESRRLQMIATDIANACKNAEKKSPILEKYQHLEVGIPVNLMLLEVNQFDQCDVKSTVSYLTIYQIEKLGEDLAKTDQYEVEDKSRGSYYRYILEAVEISLLEILKIVKKEIMN